MSNKKDKQAAALAASRPVGVENPATVVPPTTQAVEPKAAKVTKSGLPALPKLPAKRKAKPPQDCACGCGGQTKGGRFIAGHDARLHGYALRVERGLMTPAQVEEHSGSAGVRKAVVAYLAAAKAKTA